jgi:hypothetical protein
VDTGSRKENASKQQSGASVLIQSEIANTLGFWNSRAATDPGNASGIGVAASDQTQELLRRRIIFVPAVAPALLRHRATNLRVVCFGLDAVADIDGAVAHDIRPGEFAPLTHQAGESCRISFPLVGQWTTSLVQWPIWRLK